LGPSHTLRTRPTCVSQKDILNLFLRSLGASSPLFILELSRPIGIDMAFKNTTIFM